ncbi:transposase IS116/IS110/IS902 family protein [Methylocaldum marinum]|uniref:Transposase IS116/IS110/IS902 family protein n=1 Tax=Methylocaldum marinum TaxID=1432792 RepID=A0A250KTD8_9GAMM|nr:transposase IS116/IS110/IS902 family protein [Methylocaldum marinum]
MALFRVDHGLAVSVVNPAQIHAFGQAELSRTKTDKSDAKRIARFCLSQRPLLWQPPPPAVRQLQALVRRLESLLEMRQMEKNRLDGADPTVRPSIDTGLATLDAEIAATQKRIREHIDHDPDLRQRRDLLYTIPGLGNATIPVLLATLGEVHRFENARSVAAFAGLSPKEHQSGKWKGHTRLSKTGDALLRKALYLPAIVAWRHNPLIRAFCERLKAQGKKGKLIVGAAMRKRLVLAYGVLKSGRPFDPNYALAS